MFIFTPGDEHAGDLTSCILNDGLRRLDSAQDLFRSAVDGAYGKKHDRLKISSYVSIERKDGRVVDGGFVRSDNNHGFRLGGFDGFRVGGHDIGPGTFLVGACTLRANTDGLFTAQPRVACFKKNVGEGFLAANRRTEHGRLLGSCECLGDAKGHDVAAVCCFRADNGDAG